jgi:DNA-binding response OmpR family regulator
MAVVLVVDDEEMVQHFLRRALEGEGYQVFTTGSPDAALSMAQTFAVDLVITDIRNHYLQKPFTGDSLRRTVRALVSK